MVPPRQTLYWQRADPVVWDRWADFEAEIPSLGEPFFFGAEAERDYWSVTARVEEDGRLSEAYAPTTR